MQQQLAHGPHDEEEHRADHEIGNHDARTRGVDGLSGPHEQAGSDGATDGDQLNVAVAQAAAQVLHVSSHIVVLAVHGEDCYARRGQVQHVISHCATTVRSSAFRGMLE